MTGDYLNDRKSIKFHVRRYLFKRRKDLPDKTVIDIPAGNGFTTGILMELGAKAEPFDLFPEYFMIKNMECKRADISQRIPVDDLHADMLICQEGIEHFSDQLKTFKEFSRVLKMNGELLITTPSYSNLAAKFNYLLFESETGKQMPPNEIDDIWMSDPSVSKEIYHGHIFLVGLQRLRILAKLSGFRIKEMPFVRFSRGSIVLFPFLYPLILMSSAFRYFRNMKKHENVPLKNKKDTYLEQFKINISPKHLLNKHTFIVFEKETNATDVAFNFESVMKPFDRIM